jgi:hypothetical protein
MKKITLLFTLFCFALGFAQPDSAAPTPSKAAADVVSVFSDAYTPITGVDTNPKWGQQTQTTVDIIDGNETLKYANLNYQGMQFNSTDVSAMEWLHLDYYTNDAQIFKFFLISQSPTVENSYDIANSESFTTGQWVSLDIPLSVYIANKDRVFQFKTDAQPANGKTIWIDNIYFWKAPAAQGTDTSLSALTVNGSTIASFGASATNYSVELPFGTTVVPTVAATPTDTNASAVVTAATSIPGTTTIVVTAQDGVTSSTISIAWSIDPTPQNAAPTPSNDSADVISVYSDAFTTNIAGNLNPAWDQTTAMTEIQIAGNNTLEYANLNYQGLELTQTDVSAMEFVHFDYYTDDATSLKLSLISPGNPALENAYVIRNTTGSWQGVNIPLSAYTVPELDKIFQLKTEGDGTIWIDNIYFWKTPSVAGTDTTLSDLTIYGQTIADFGASKTNYNVELPAGATVVPGVAAFPTDTNASAVVTAATSIPGTTTIVVTAQDGVTTRSVSINWSIDPKPQTAAPTPSQDSSDVISVYSDTYTDNIFTNLNPGWEQATAMAEVQIAGNNTLEYANLNYQGLELTQTDVSAMEYVHLDYYANDATALEFFLISPGDTPLNAKENAYDIAASEAFASGQWVSLDIPLSAYTVPELDKIFQIKTVGNGTVWIDNIYFWKAPTAAGTQLADLTVDGSTITDFGASKTSYSVELPFGTTTAPTVAATTADTNASAVVTAATSIPGTTTIEITAADGVTTSTVSIAFSINSTPTTAAPTPTWESDDVIAVFSDAYDNIAANLYPDWGQQTQTTEPDIDGNNTLEYANLNYQGTEYPETDVSGMGYLHLDYFTTDATALEFFLITDGGVDAEGKPVTDENAYDIAALESFALGQWVSLDIPLTFYSDAGQDLSKAIQFKTEGNGTIYLDNLYFFNSGEAGVGNVLKEALPVAPNPTSGLINVAGDVYNVSGQKVLTNSNDLSGLPSGIYFIKVIANGNVSTTKIIKE